MPSDLLSKATAAAIAVTHATNEKYPQNYTGFSVVSKIASDLNNIPPNLNRQTRESRLININMGHEKNACLRSGVDVVIRQGLLLPISPSLSCSSEGTNINFHPDYKII